MKLRYFAVAAVLVAVPVAAIAHEHGRGHHDRPGRAQLDENGNLTADAVRTASAERFKRIDRNGDGVITPDEAPGMFDRPDANGDGKVTPDELTAVAEARLKRADANGDGVVSKEERKAMRAKFRGPRDGDGPDAPPADAPPPN